MSILNQGQRIDKYTVEYAIKTNAYCETYRVADDNGNPFFLKLYIIKNIPQKLLKEGEVLEIHYAKQLKHKNIISYIDSGTLMIPEGVCHYMVTVYFTGELLVEKVEREGPLPFEEAKRIFKGILEALKYMHENSLYHNDITPHNIMLSSLTDGEPELIDMGHVSHSVAGIAPFDTADLDAAYCSNSTFIGTYDDSTDLFSAIAVFFFMLTGEAPWNINIEAGTPRPQAILTTKKARREALNLDKIDKELHNFFLRALTGKRNERFSSASEVLAMLENPSSAKPPKSDSSSSASASAGNGGSHRESEENLTGINIPVQHGSGNGFKDIAGMSELKDMLQKRVILILRDRELAEEYRLTPPNGMLLYGPPGCGKSFFAEKFAEETGFAYIYVKASDLGSVYIHGTQGKIAELFKLAEKNAPAVICFDEFDAFVPDRSNDLGNHHAGEVNEFLSQLNNCSKRGIFVIASTNRPDMVDPAVIRTGRIDKLVYVPLPDLEARREMLALYMKDRPCEELDYQTLAELSEGYVASDIAYVVNEVATIAAFKREKITQELMETTIKSIKPSIRPDRMEEYEAIRERMEGLGRGAALPHVGFNTDKAE